MTNYHAFTNDGRLQLLSPTAVPRSLLNDATEHFKTTEFASSAFSVQRSVFLCTRTTSWIIPPSGLLRGVEWFETDVSGLPIGPIFKGQAVRTVSTSKMGPIGSPETSVSTAAKSYDHATTRWLHTKGLRMFNTFRSDLNILEAWVPSLGPTNTHSARLTPFLFNTPGQHTPLNLRTLVFGLTPSGRCAVVWNLQLIPWSRALRKKLSGLQLVKKLLAFYATRRFITAFTTAYYSNRYIFHYLLWFMSFLLAPAFEGTQLGQKGGRGWGVAWCIILYSKIFNHLSAKATMICAPLPLHTNLKHWIILKGIFREIGWRRGLIWFSTGKEWQVVLKTVMDLRVGGGISWEWGFCSV